MSCALTAVLWPNCQVRVAAGLLTDRRPEGVCALPLDCLARDKRRGAGAGA